jgi:hypothetical protein
MAQLVEPNQVGKREQLFDIIALDDYKEKPLLAMIPKEQKLQNMQISWQADQYATPDTGGSADGTPVGNIENAAADRARIYVYAQKFRRTAGVGSVAEEISKVAGASEGEMAMAIDKKLEEISRDMEAALGSDNATQAEASTAVPYKLRGLGDWITNSAQTVLPVDSNYRTPTASINATATASLTEVLFKGVLESVFTTYGKSQDLDLVCGTALKKAITGFTQTSSSSASTVSIRSFNANLSEKKITANITIYEGDFNTIKTHVSLLLGQTGTTATDAARGYVLPMDRLSLHYGWQPKVTPLAPDGSGPRAMIEAVLGLCVKNPKVLGKFNATS